MNKAELQTLLKAYRPSGADQDDPLFAEALQAVEQDLELGAWWADWQRWDAALSSQLQKLPAPQGLKEKILRGAPLHILPQPPKARRVSRASLAWAALLAVALALGTLWGLTHRPSSPAQALAVQAISYSQQMPPVQFVCFSPDAVKSWVAERPLAQALGVRLEKTVSSMEMFGSSMTEWHGKPVVMLVLQNREQMGYLYLVRTSDFSLGQATDFIDQRAGWVAKVHQDGSLAWVLVTRGGREKLNFEMPL